MPEDTPKRAWLTPDRYDLAVYALLVGLGILAFVLSRGGASFVEDLTYFELAKSLIRGTGYGFNFKPETMVPPGFAYLLALLIMALGYSHSILVRAMTVCTTFAFILTYAILRRQQSRAAAATICLLLASSPVFFQFSTTIISSDMPYFLTSTVLLWALMQLESARGPRWTQALWWLLCLMMLFASLLIRSTGIALLAGMLGWQTISFVRDRETAKRRLHVFVPLLILGMAVQMGWMHWAVKHQFYEWPVHGYQENYLAQLRIKNGNDPELGLATWKDILLRPVNNADDRGAALWALVTRKPMAPAWYSPTTSLPIIVVLLGLGLSFWKTGGGALEWYFLSYEAMYLFWPWDFEERFLLPVAPLACLYLWRGGAFLAQLAKREPRRVAAMAIALAVVSTIGTIVWGLHAEHPRARSCIALWALVAVAGAALCVMGKRESTGSAAVPLGKVVSFGARSIPQWRALVGMAFTVLFVAGVALQLRVGQANLHFRLEDQALYPDIEASQWIQANSLSSAVVMARHEDVAYEYSQRRIVWFPPSTNARMLMDGIHRYHVQYVVVGEGNDNYWRPPAKDCLDALIQTYPGTFFLVHSMPHEKVYEIPSEIAD